MDMDASSGSKQQLHNLFFQGRLFEHVPADPKRQGAVKYPLIGLFDAVGVSTPADRKSGSDTSSSGNAKSTPQLDPAWIGIDELRWADQHVHKVDLYDGETLIADSADFHFGSDMARFAGALRARAHHVLHGSDSSCTRAVSTHVACARGWAVCLDLSDQRENGPSLDVTLLLIVAPELEDAIERCLRAVPRGKDGDYDLAKLASALAAALKGKADEATIALVTKLLADAHAATRTGDSGDDSAAGKASVGDASSDSKASASASASSASSASASL